MPKDDFRAAQCEGKEKHTADNARRIARKGKDPSLQAYKCPHCRHWHIGGRQKRKSKR